MSAGVPDTLISVGYDCVINIFDTRRKTQPVQLNYCHPLSTVAMTDCGTYFCVGNLKGELTTLDMRNTKVCLATRKVHDNAVTRVAFVPAEGDDRAASASFSSNTSSKAIENTFDRLPGGRGSDGSDSRKSIVVVTASTPAAAGATHAKRDSFCDFFDFQANKGMEKISSRFSTRRDSYDWDALTRKQPPPPNSEDNNRASLLRIGSGLSSIGSANNSVTSGDSFDDKRETALADPLRERINSGKLLQQFNDKLTQIKEEQALPNQSENSPTDSDKENPPPPPISLELGRRLRIHPSAAAFGNHGGTLIQTQSPMETFSTPKRVSSPKPMPTVVTSAVASAPTSTEVSQQIADLRAEMNERFRQLEMELKFNAETNKWQIFTQASHIWNQQIDNTEDIRVCMGLLLQTDPFVQEFLRLVEENRLLKSQLQHARDK